MYINSSPLILNNYKNKLHEAKELMLEVTNLREYLNIDSCFNPNSNCFYLKRLELVLQPELLLRGEPHPDLPDERNGRRPEE